MDDSDETSEVIKCEQGEIIYIARCDAGHKTVEVRVNDDYGEQVSRTTYHDVDASFCRRSFDLQFGNSFQQRFETLPR